MPCPFNPRLWSPPAGSTALARNGVLEWRTLHIGGWLHLEEEVQMTSPVSNFAGSMQQLTFNGMPYLEMARAQVPGNLGGPGAAASSGGAGGAAHITVTATIGKRDSQLVHHPVHFKSKHTFVGLPTLKAYSVTNIYFQVLLSVRFGPDRPGRALSASSPALSNVAPFHASSRPARPTASCCTTAAATTTSWPWSSCPATCTSSSTSATARCACTTTAISRSTTTSGTP